MKNAFLFCVCAGLLASNALAALPNIFSRWKATVIVIDESGRPVADCDVTVGYYIAPRAGESVSMAKKTGRTGAPYGKGTRADFLFTAHLDKRAKDDWDHKLVLTFPNPGDGIQSFAIPKTEETSAFRSRYEAPTNGYQLTWVKTRGQRPGRPLKWVDDKSLKFFSAFGRCWMNRET